MSEKIIEEKNKEENTVENSLSRLLEHLLNDKKLGRASTIFIELANISLSCINSSLFFNIIQSLMSDCPTRDIFDQKFINFYIDIFKAIESKLCLFEHNQKYRLITFSMFINMRNDLKTSDSFQFAKACTAVKALFESESIDYRSRIEENVALKDNEKEGAKLVPVDTLHNEDTHNDASITADDRVDEDCMLERQRVLLAILSTATDNYKWTWAQHSIDSLVQTAAENRLTFPADIREELDSLTERITQQKRKNLSYTGFKKVVSSSSIAHPLFSKKYDTLI